MAAFPPTLPQLILSDGYAEEYESALIRTSVDVGPPKVRARYTTEIFRFSGTLILTTDQVSTMETFYQTTLNGGVDYFTWTHPRTKTTVDMRLINRPSIELLGNGYWRCGLSCEVTP